MNKLIHNNVNLSDKNWFRTGGPARFYAEPTSAREFQEALSFATAHSLDLFLLGEGANILISDDGFDGLVIRPQLNSIFIEHFENGTLHVTAGAGVSMEKLINFCLNHKIGGLEEFSGIPGTVGGAAYINLHYFQYLLSDFLIRAQVINKATNEILTVDNDWFEFGYNQSKLISEEYYLVNATFELEKLSDEEVAYAHGRRFEIIRHRNQRYPTAGTCGSFFRNFLEDEVTLVSNGKKMTFVAYYLDKIGVKGALAVGDAIVSYKHANMLVNQGHASSDDFIALARRLQEKVHDEFGVLPQPECRLIGFTQYPLLTKKN
jgi:UDP-N-acetylmuramate dehydrogenase